MNNILTVTQLNYSVRHLLEVEFGSIWLTGEISNFVQPVSGHWYFTLKDDKAQVRSAMFRMRNNAVNFKPQNGMQVLVNARISLYEPRGDYQLIVENMQMAGDGLLQQKFEQLKTKLANIGLFNQEHKKNIPSFIKTVGIVTSSTGAALQDILTVLQRRSPSLKVIIYPTLVQGKEATRDIIRSIEIANLRQECDVLIVGRGGGSLEDLWCFNEEELAYAIYNSDLPIISAVGHEIDFTIADFVSDLRAPTPSAAAELISQDQQAQLRQLQYYYDKINFAFDRLWNTKLTQFKQLQTRLYTQHPLKQIHYQKEQLQQLEKHLLRNIQYILQTKNQKMNSFEQRIKLNPLANYLTQQKQQCTYLNQRLEYAIEKKFSYKQQLFHQFCTQLEGLSPLKVLTRGYSVTKNEKGTVIISSKKVKKGELIQTRLSKGVIVSQVVEIKK